MNCKIVGWDRGEHIFFFFLTKSWQKKKKRSGGKHTLISSLQVHMWQMKAENNKLVEKHTECKCFHTGLEGMLWWEWKMMRVTCSSVTNPTEHLWGDFGAPCQTDSVLHPSKTLNEGISFGRMLFVPSEEFYTLENRPRKAAGGKTSLLWLGFKFGFQICHVYWGSTSLLKRSVHTDSDIYDCSKVWAT